MEYELFKAYVPTKEKKCLIPFKNVNPNELYSYDEIKSMKEYAGILNTDTILIDIDDYSQSEILFNIIKSKKLKCRVYETKRGKHFLFLNKKIINCKTHCKIACGLTADIKTGKKNSYSILKYNNIDRKIIYDCENYDEIPKYLYPVNSKINFLEMESGDGRNQALFNYILTLQSNDFSVNESRECLEIINDFILSEPLEKNELDTLSRDEAFTKPVFFKGNIFLFDKFAHYLKNTYNIIKISGRLHIYKEGIYVDAQNEIEYQMINNISNLNSTKRNEVLKYLDILVRESKKLSSAEYIAFNNGIYNVITDELIPFSPDIIITNKINHDFNRNAKSDLVDNVIKKLACNDESIVKLLEESVGYTFYRRNELRKSFILTGEKKNGKSTFLAMIKEMLGEENVSSLDLSNLGERFSTSSMFNMLANIGDDIGDDFISNPAIFKKIVSGDRIKAEYKNQKEFFFEPYCKLFFSANNIPRIKDKSGAVIDRLIIIPFNAKFDKNDIDYDPFIKYKLLQKESIEYLILLGLNGLKRVLENQAFTTSDKAQKELEEYELNNNPILLFFEEISKDEIINNSTSDIYKKYKGFCYSNSYNEMSQNEFSKQVKKYFNVEIKVKRVNGKQYRVFLDKEHLI